MAEGLLKTIYGDRYEVYSAGVDPTKVNTYAIEVLKEIGIDISNNKSKSIEEFRDMSFDIVVTVCDNAKETCPFFPGNKIIHIGFDDPSKVKGDKTATLDEFRKVRDEINTWIKKVFKENN
jgi:arsenate reductase